MTHGGVWVQGDALPGLQTFCDWYTEDARRLWTFLRASEQFLWRVIDDFGRADDELVRVLNQLSLDQRR